MTLIKKIMRTAVLIATCGVGMASSPSPAIDLNSPDVLSDDAKPKDARAALFIRPTGEPLQAQITFDPDLVDSLCDGPSDVRFGNSQVKHAISGMSYLYKRLATVAGNAGELKTRLYRFIDSGHPLRAVFTLDSTHDILDLGNAVNATAYQQLSDTLRYENYGELASGDLSADHAERHALFVANQAKRAATGSASEPTATRKVTAVSVPAPVIAVDPTSPTILRDDATPQDAMAVLLVNKTTHLSGCMYNIAFDPSLLLGLIPEDLKTTTLQRPKVDRFRDSRVQNLITGIKLIYDAAMETIGHDKERFKNVLTRLNSEGHALVVPFKLNLDDESLDFINPFTGFDVEFEKVTQLKESVKTGTNKFLAPGETRTLDAEYAARQRVIDATRGTASVPVPMAVAVPDVRGSGAGGFSGASSRSADLARLGITEDDIALVQLNFPGAVADLRTGMFLTEGGEEMGGIRSLASQLK